MTSFIYDLLFIVVMDDIEQGLGCVHTDIKDLQQLQLERNRIKVVCCDVVLSCCNRIVNISLQCLNCWMPSCYIEQDNNIVYNIMVGHRPCYWLINAAIGWLFVPINSFVTIILFIGLYDMWCYGYYIVVLLPFITNAIQLLLKVFTPSKHRLDVHA